MSIKEDMPICPAAIVIAKPKRSRWCLDEAWDIATVIGGKVIETRFEGVFILLSDEKLNRIKLEEAIRKYRFSFASRVVIPRECIDTSRTDIESWLKNLLHNLRDIELARLIVSLRGLSKHVIQQEKIKDLLIKNGIRVSRKSSFIIDLEGIDELIAISWGRSKACGYSCILIG